MELPKGTNGAQKISRFTAIRISYGNSPLEIVKRSVVENFE
jgi:hypothetical protein